MTNPSSSSAANGKCRNENGEECAEQLTDQAAAGQEILVGARDAAAKQGILIIPYIVALYVEYLDVREEAVGKYGERAVQSLENELLRACDARVLIRPPPRRRDPMFA